MTFDPVKCMAGDPLEGDLVTRLRIWFEQEEGFVFDICGEAADRIEELEAALQLATEMRVMQKAYFKDRTKDALINSKMSEAAFDRAMLESRND
jgi:hypothetical protein